MNNLNLFLEELSSITPFEIENKKALELTKGEILETSSKILQDVIDGFTDGIDVLILAKKLEIFSEALKEGVKGHVEMPEDKDFKKHGCVLNTQLMGVRYDYSVCGHTVWNELNEKQTAIKEEMKPIEKLIKGAKDGSYIDEETGELVPCTPPLKSGTQSLIIKVK